MSEQMDFDDGKYTVVSDNGRLKALHYGQPWRDLTGDHLVYAMLVKAIQLKEERDALAAKLKDQDAQIDDLLATCHRLALELECLLLDTKDAAPVSRWWDSAMAALDGWHKAKDAASVRPVPAEPVNAQLLEALHSIRQYGLDTLSGRADGGDDDYAWQRAAVNEMTKRARIALALAAKLKELDGQEAVAWVGHGPRDGRVEFSISKPVPSVFHDFGFKPLFARPVPAEPALAVWFGSMPESNGKTNWTAILHRRGEEPWKGITIDRSEYKDRVRYEADRLRWLIGELDQEPDILVYDEDLTEQVPAESVNARLLDLVKRFQDYMHGPTAWNPDQEDELSQEISAAIAEAQQAEAAAGLTRTDREAVPAWCRHQQI